MTLFSKFVFPFALTRSVQCLCCNNFFIIHFRVWTIPHFIFNHLGYPFGIFILVITFVYEIFRIVLNAKIILILKEEMDQSEEQLQNITLPSAPPQPLPPPSYALGPVPPPITMSQLLSPIPHPQPPAYNDDWSHTSEKNNALCI